MVDEKDLYTLKINCKGKRTVGKANKEINVEKYNRYKTLKVKIVKKRKDFLKRKIKKKRRVKGKLHRAAKAQHRCRDLS